MEALHTIKTALLSVYHKDNLAPIVHLLASQGVQFISTGGTQKFIEQLGYPVQAVEALTGYPEIFDGRVKTLHPAIFGGILMRTNHNTDQLQAQENNITPIDLVIVDLYPFEETLAAGGTPEEIIEKIDIGGISLIRAAAKNFERTLIVSHRGQYAALLALLEANAGGSTLAQRRVFAKEAFETSSHYDTAIHKYFLGDVSETDSLKISVKESVALRYGENPHQWGRFYGKLSELLEQLHGKELSYNNLVDIDAAMHLMAEFPIEEGACFAILKHTNACGIAKAADVAQAYQLALASDPVSAFGGVLIANDVISKEAAELMNALFFEVLIAPEFTPEALELLKQKKNRILLVQKQVLRPKVMLKSLLNGFIAMEADVASETVDTLKLVSQRKPSEEELAAMLFAAKVCKHTKSNAIVLANASRMISSGTGQTSRVDALEQAIAKAKRFNFSLEGAAMASDAFFPFPDCVEIAFKAGISAVIHPGGSIKDQDSIDFVDAHQMAMAITGIRHFKH